MDVRCFDTPVVFVEVQRVANVGELHVVPDVTGRLLVREDHPAHSDVVTSSSFDESSAVWFLDASSSSGSFIRLFSLVDLVQSVSGEDREECLLVHDNRILLYPDGSSGVRSGGGASVAPVSVGSFLCHSSTLLADGAVLQCYITVRVDLVVEVSGQCHSCVFVPEVAVHSLNFTEVDPGDGSGFLCDLGMLVESVLAVR